MSELKVNKISPATGTAFTLGDSGDTFTVPSGATITNSGTATGFGGGGKVKQMVYNMVTGVVTGTGVIPYDNTIPQNTEGLEMMTQAITPTSASSLLKIEVVVQGSCSSHAQFQIALFQDSTANALAVSRIRADAQQAVHLNNNNMMHVMVSGTTSATTFKVRLGVSSGVVWLNATSANTGGLFGGKCNSGIVVTEYETGI